MNSSTKDLRKNKQDDASKSKASESKKRAFQNSATDIDLLFTDVKSKKTEKKNTVEVVPAEKLKVKKKKNTVDEGGGSYGIITSDEYKTIISPEAPLERIDPETGFPVYKAHLLKVGEGGGTPLCPFDCDCCF